MVFQIKTLLKKVCEQRYINRNQVRFYTELQNSNRILKKYWNDKGDYFVFEEHCYGTHLSQASMALEDNIRQAAWNISKDNVIIDAGAHYGSYTLPALAAGATVHTFEINDYILQSLKNNVALNQFNKCHFIDKALWDKSGENILISEEHLSSFHFGQIKEDDQLFERETLRLDDYVNFNVDYIKIDVEGAELKVLDGGLETLRKYKPRMLIETHSLENQESLLDFLKINFDNYIIHGIYPEIQNFGKVSHIIISFK